MKQRHAVFSFALLLAIAGVAIVSIFNNNDLFGDIAQALTLPLLILSLVHVLASIPSKAIERCTYNIEWLEIMLPDAKDLHIWEESQNRQENVNAIEMHLRQQKEIINRLKPYENASIVIYAFSLCLLIFSGFLATMISPYFEFVTLPIFTFIAIIIFVWNVLFGDRAVHRIIQYFYEKIVEQCATI